LFVLYNDEFYIVTLQIPDIALSGIFALDMLSSRYYFFRTPMFTLKQSRAGDPGMTPFLNWYSFSIYSG
jgi:hypothetical protein